MPASRLLRPCTRAWMRVANALITSMRSSGGAARASYCTANCRATGGQADEQSVAVKASAPHSWQRQAVVDSQKAPEAQQANLQPTSMPSAALAGKCCAATSAASSSIFSMDA